VTDPNAPPMGMRLRLRTSFDISGFSPANQVILRALQQYGMILADNGSAIYISGAPDSGWNNDDLHNLGSVTAADFDVVAMSQIYTEANVPTGPPPTITSFTASPTTVSAGQPVTLSWVVSNSDYNIVTPQVGPVRGSSVMITPSATATYSFVATNQYGRTTQAVKITVQ
jgi:hypothetical protein